MVPEERAELIRLCRVHLAERRLPLPLPSTASEYAVWRERVVAPVQYDADAEDAWFELDRLAHEEPDEAWQILIDLVASVDNEQDLHTIGAGVLETFVQSNGPGFVAEIEKEVLGSNAFATAMRVVNGIERFPELDDRLREHLKWQ